MAGVPAALARPARNPTRAASAIGRRLRRWMVRIVAAATLVAALALAPRLVAGGGRRLAELEADLARAHATIAAKQAALAEKRRHLRALRTQPQVIEDIARDELGLIYPGELVIRVEGRR